MVKLKILKLYLSQLPLMILFMIAIFNIVGSLTMLVMDKQKDIAILTGLGATARTIQGIFFFEGMLITMIGCIAGMFVGLIFSLAQQYFQMIKMGGMLNAYPVEIKINDFLLVFLTVTVIGCIASGISARLSLKGLADIKQDL